MAVKPFNHIKLKGFYKNKKLLVQVQILHQKFIWGVIKHDYVRVKINAEM
jgi:hypothetical protein